MTGADDGFGPDNLPYGVFTPAAGGCPRVGVAINDQVLDVAALATADGVPDAQVLAAPSLNALLAAGPEVWARVRGWLQSRLRAGGVARQDVQPKLHPLAAVTLHLPFEVADYVDFYASEHHATNVGKLFRPGSDPLTPNWKHLPIGYHGRAGSVVVSGTPVVRPCGQRKPVDGGPVFGPAQRLDIEAEVGYVVGVPSTLGESVAVDRFADHVFGVCLVNDWSARDIQAWEYVPLGPFLGKSFATSVSPWIVPLAALDAARVAPPPRHPELLPYLRDDVPWGLDLALEVSLNGTVVSRPPFHAMYWTGAQMLAHLTVNGASVRTGDLYASGTVSGPEPSERGSLLELAWGGQTPIDLPDGTTRTFLADGDDVTITASAPGTSGRRISLGAVSGRIMPAR